MRWDAGDTPRLRGFGRHSRSGDVELICRLDARGAAQAVEQVFDLASNCVQLAVNLAGNGVQLIVTYSEVQTQSIAFRKLSATGATALCNKT